MRYAMIALGVLMFALAACGGAGGGGSGGGLNLPPAAPSLSISTQPAGAQPATTFTTQPVVELRDGTGALVTNDSITQVTASIQTGTGTSGAALTGTATVTASSGVATFTGLSIDLAGTGYRLRFTATSFAAASSNAFNVGSSGGAVITPSAPPASNVTFNVNSQNNARAISRYIYGMNGAPFNGSRPANLTLTRSGGNRMTAYNWENNASNAGVDWYNQNDSYLGGGATPGGAVTPGISDAHTHNASIIVTVPLIGYVAADTSGGGDVNQTSNYLANRFKVSQAKKGAAFSNPPSTADNFVYQDEFIYFLKQSFPGAATNPNKTIFYSLDNEPDLWASTHPRLRGDATTGGNPPGTAGNGSVPTYAEMLTRTKDYADAIKDVESNAIVFGPVNYGWLGMVNFQGASDAGTHGDFLNYYLAQLAAAESSYGHRLVDVLDIHWYPEAGANNSSGNWTRVTADSTDANVVAARLQAPRSLWDPTYTEDSWIAQYSTLGPVRLLPRLQDKINANYPGTKMAITEYYYGGGDHISGGIAQADALGIFGREGLFAATLWKLGSTNHSFIYGGFEMFRNYDAANGSFGNTSIEATNPDVAGYSVYASVDAGNPDRMVLVVINKTNQSRTAGIAVTHTAQFNVAEVYQLTSANSQPQRVSDMNITLTNAFQYTMPANSVTTLVLKP
ncbi:MAG: endoglucanase A [Planctomycetes bacterium]|nr:endoglucanase A [Planctomycetota bacterium]